MSDIANLSIKISQLSQELLQKQHQANHLADRYDSLLSEDRLESEVEDAYNLWQDMLDMCDDLEAEISELQEEIEELSEHEHIDEEY